MKSMATWKMLSVLSGTVPPQLPSWDLSPVAQGVVIFGERVFPGGITLSEVFRLVPDPAQVVPFTHRGTLDTETDADGRKMLG